jgi:hypothetical protein
LLCAHSTAQAADEFQLLRLDDNFVKWGSPALGTGATVRYAFVAGAMQFAGALNCVDMAPVGPLLRASGIARAAFEREVIEAFAMWEAAADISFEQVTDPAKADILIGSQGRPRGWAFANVAFDRNSDQKTRRIEKSLICLDPTRPWKIGFGGDARAYDVRYVMAHEIGHAIGLDHPGAHGQVMAFAYGEKFRALQPGDIKGVIALYGKRGTQVTAATPARESTSATRPAMALR